MLDQWFLRLRHGEPISCAVDNIFSPLWLDDAVSLMMRLIWLKENGIFNITGPEALPRSTMLEVFIRKVICHSAAKHLTPRVDFCSLADIPDAADQPKNTSLCANKTFHATGLESCDFKGIIDQWVRHRLEMIGDF